jgi:hypothetical protein
MARIACEVTLALCCLTISSPSDAQDIPRTFVCGNLTATDFHTRTPPSIADESTGQQAMLEFKEEKPGSRVKWFYDGKVHHESFGFGIPMKAGFAILIVADDRVETYVFNTETSELLLAIMDSASFGPANPIRTLRGSCEPAGILVQ